VFRGLTSDDSPAEAEIHRSADSRAGAHAPIIWREGERPMPCLFSRILIGMSQLVRVAAWTVWITGASVGCLLCYAALATEAGFLGLVAGVILTPLTYVVTPLCAFFSHGSGELLAINYGSLIFGAWLNHTAGCLGAAAGALGVGQTQPA
jgi:hypothetical protein